MSTAYVPSDTIKVGDFLVCYDGVVEAIRETKTRYYVTVNGVEKSPIDKRGRVLVARGN